MVSKKEKITARILLPFVAVGYVAVLAVFHLAIVLSGAFSFADSKALFDESLENFVDDVQDTWKGNTPLFTRK